MALNDVGQLPERLGTTFSPIINLILIIYTLQQPTTYNLIIHLILVFMNILVAL